MFESKAQADEKAQHTWEYVSILKRLVMHLSVIELAQIPLRGATQLSDIRWGFEDTSNLFHSMSQDRRILLQMDDFRSRKCPMGRDRIVACVRLMNWSPT
jgi:hypothetical protein